MRSLCHLWALRELAWGLFIKIFHVCVREVKLREIRRLNCLPILLLFPLYMKSHLIYIHRQLLIIDFQTGINKSEKFLLKGVKLVDWKWSDLRVDSVCKEEIRWEFDRDCRAYCYKPSLLFDRHLPMNIPRMKPKASIWLAYAVDVNHNHYECLWSTFGVLAYPVHVVSNRNLGN